MIEPVAVIPADPKAYLDLVADEVRGLHPQVVADALAREPGRWRAALRVLATQIKSQARDYRAECRYMEASGLPLDPEREDWYRRLKRFTVAVDARLATLRHLESSNDGKERIEFLGARIRHAETLIALMAEHIPTDTPEGAAWHALYRKFWFDGVVV